MARRPVPTPRAGQSDARASRTAEVPVTGSGAGSARPWDADRWRALVAGHGQHLLRSFLDGDQAVAAELGELFAALDTGALDRFLAARPDPDEIHVTTSCHLMVLALRNRLAGLEAEGFYKGDPLRYVRSNLLVQRLLGLHRLTLGWPVYAFGAEVLGQTMMYPSDQAPGSDPGVPLLTLTDWSNMPRYDPGHPIAGLVRETLRHMHRLSGMAPVAHLPAPYSLAAEVLGQEALIPALSEAPDLVRSLLDLIVDRVLKPWCDDLARSVPDVWLELSDASGSPMFIGPRNFLDIAVAPVRRLIEDNRWGDRVFVANYRGDLPPPETARGRRRRAAPAEGAISFESLLETKKLCCPEFLTRLEADAAPPERYAETAISQRMPLYLGIGAVRLDRNSVTDLAAARAALFEDARRRAGLIRNVSDALAKTGLARACLAWPGDLYVEDTNAETHFDLLNEVLRGCRS